MKRRLALVAILIAIFVLYASHPWEWSLMDDTNFVLRLQKFTAQYGLLGGIWQHFRDLSISDRSWGLFRPSWWAYASTIYLLPSQAAYAIRLLMFYGIILFPLLTFRRLNVAIEGGAANPSFGTEIPSNRDDSASETRRVNLPWLTGVGACLLLCNRPLYEGMSCLSMQEFSGCFFVALGIWLGFREPMISSIDFKRENRSTDKVDRRFVLQTTHQSNSPASGFLTAASLMCFIIAAWFKTPFLWFLILYCLGLRYFENRRLAAILGLAVSLFTLVRAISWARHGGYTARITALHFATIVTALKNFIVPGSYAIVLSIAVMALLTLALRPAANSGFGTSAPATSGVNTSLRSSSALTSIARVFPLRTYWRGYALLLGGAIYLANLLPWGAFGYYFMGPIFLLSAGVMFTVLTKLNELELTSERRAAVSGLATFLLCFVLLKSTFKIYFKDEAVRFSRDWAMTLPREGLTLGYNGEEASVRFSQLMEIRSDHAWKNTVTFIPAEAPHFDYLNYYVISKEATFSKDACREVLIDFKAGQICRSK